MYLEKMEFGRVRDLDGIDLRLPPDDPATASALRGPADGGRPEDRGRPEGGARKPEVLVGLPIWDNDDIARLVCPAGTPRTGRLAGYARAYNAIELNSSGYGLSAANAAVWASRTPPGFRFCPKVPREISHGTDLGRAGPAYEAFCRAAEAFGDRLGTALLQFQDTFGPARLPELEAFLRAHGGRIPLAVELRHPGWFANPRARAASLDLLAELGLIAVIADVPARRDMLHMRLTVPRAFLRFSGHDRSGPDRARIEAWAYRIKGWLDRGLEQVHVFVHHVPEHVSVAWSEDVVDALNRVCGLGLPSPTRFAGAREEPQLDLFAS